METEWDVEKSRILDCFNNQSDKLYLNSLDLESLPDVFEFLPQLQKLDICS